MFYTRNEQTTRVGYWCKHGPVHSYRRTQAHWSTVLMNGTAQIISGFLSFGVLHISGDSGLQPWQWYDRAQIFYVQMLTLR